MLFNYLYILNNFEPAFFESDQDSDCFIIPVNTNVTGKRTAVFQTLFRSSAQFCFSVSDNIAGASKLFIQTEIVHNFSRLLFLPNYLRIGGRQVLFIEPSDGNKDTSLTIASTLREEFGKQGIDILLIEPQHIAAEGINGGKASEHAIWHAGLDSFLSAPDNHSNFETFTKGFPLPLHLNKKWLVRATNKEELNRKKKQLEKLETWLKGTQSFKVQLMEMATAATAENDALKDENKLLYLKLENSAQYLKLIREESMGMVYEIGSLRAGIQRGSQAMPDDTVPGSDDELLAHYQKVLLDERKRADDTFNWYHEEYEVLPRWFKRIGQLIRVLMGKRSFASLFNKSKHDTGTKSTEQSR